MEVKCYNKKCLHEWDYQGENKKFVCCPKCRYKRLLSKCREFFLKNDRPSDIQSDRPSDIPNVRPHHTIVKEKQKEFIGRDPYENPTLITDKLGRVWKFPEFLK